jgi:predicted nicotinamide N-methyase
MAPPLQTCVDTHHFDGIAYRIRRLIDGNQFDDPDGITEALGISSASWPLFGMLWPSGLLLADLISRETLGPGKILELGCGLGMASLVANARGADILATDYHPRAAVFLQDNSRRNALADTPFRRLDWRVPEPDLGVFSLIIGSDLLYEPDHPDLLTAFLVRHSDAATRIIIVDPKRRLHVRFRKQMAAAGFDCHRETGSTVQFAAYGFKGVVQRFSGFNPPQ